MGEQTSVVTQAGERAAARPALEHGARPTQGLYRRAWGRFRHDRLAMGSLILLLAIVGFSVGAPVVSNLTGFSPSENHLPEKLSKPGENGYVLGSDANGRDILTRLAYGGRVSLLVAICGTIAQIVLGLGLGLTAGYFGKWVDSVIMRLVDVMFSIPSLALLILISTLYTPGVLALAVIIGLISWPGDARLIRGEVLSLRARDYVEAARVIGATNARIIFQHILPNVMAPAITLASIGLGAAILAESSLSFLGLGVPPDVPTWGGMLAGGGRRWMLQAWWMAVFPGLVLSLTVYGFNMLGDALRDLLDPRLRGSR